MRPDFTEIEIEEIAYHRNGIAGIGFHVVLFRWYETGEEDAPRNMIGVVTELDEESEALREAGEFYNTPTAVFDRDSLAVDNIEFGRNSWRGDEFDAALRDACEKRYEDDAWYVAQ